MVNIYMLIALRCIYTVLRTVLLRFFQARASSKPCASWALLPCFFEVLPQEGPQRE